MQLYGKKLEKNVNLVNYYFI